jgi:hypothetical protein
MLGTKLRDTNLIKHYEHESLWINLPPFIVEQLRWNRIERLGIEVKEGKLIIQPSINH